MNILYTINNGFVPQVGAGICSVCENNLQSEKIRFFIVSAGISEDNKEELTKLVVKYKREIEIIELPDLKTFFDFEFDTLGWNPIVLARLLVDKLLPNDVDRVLYLDGDTIVRGDLSELWGLNMHGKTIGMSIEPTIGQQMKRDLNLIDYPYHNAGVLLIDLKRWRETNAGKIIIDFYRENDGKLLGNDQDAINVSMKDEIYVISPKYNFYNIFYQYSYRFLCKLMNPVKYISEEVYQNAIKDPVIIHYLGEERPWREGNTHKYKNDYWKYLNMTYWKDTPEEKGWKLYFVCWRIFNVITKPFPGIRHAIIFFLIPYILKYRARIIKKGK